MSLIVAFPKELETKVQETAGRQVLGAEEFVLSAAERVLKKASLDEILAPVRQQFAESGMTEGQLTKLVKEERYAIRAEKEYDRIAKAIDALVDKGDDITPEEDQLLDLLCLGGLPTLN